MPPNDIFRGMKADPADGLPIVGDHKAKLGVVVGPGPLDDVAPTAAGTVIPGTGGMSVADDPLKLPAHRRPKSLAGTANHPVFRFPVANLPNTLSLRQDEPLTDQNHYVVEPAEEVAVGDFKAALGATRGGWRNIE